MCRTALSELDLQKVIIKALEELMEGDENPNLPQSKELTGLIQKYGTKMGNLIYYLRNLWKKGPSKVIIFSQASRKYHGPVQRNLTRALSGTKCYTESAILCDPTQLRASTCEGKFENIDLEGDQLTALETSRPATKPSQHSKVSYLLAIRFTLSDTRVPGKDSKAKVIMLSLDNAASGTNLTEASHIFLMGTCAVRVLNEAHSLLDPVSGTKEEALATERQAIGRAHRLGQNSQVTVVRMIISKLLSNVRGHLC